MSTAHYMKHIYVVHQDLASGALGDYLSVPRVEQSACCESSLMIPFRKPGLFVGD
jgi:hypothetical protein